MIRVLGGSASFQILFMGIGIVTNVLAARALGPEGRGGLTALLTYAQVIWLAGLLLTGGNDVLPQKSMRRSRLHFSWTLLTATTLFGTMTLATVLLSFVVPLPLALPDILLLGLFVYLFALETCLRDTLQNSRLFMWLNAMRALAGGATMLMVAVGYAAGVNVVRFFFVAMLVQQAILVGALLAPRVTSSRCALEPPLPTRPDATGLAGLPVLTAVRAVAAHRRDNAVDTRFTECGWHLRAGTDHRQFVHRSLRPPSPYHQVDHRDRHDRKARHFLDCCNRLGGGDDRIRGTPPHSPPALRFALRSSFRWLSGDRALALASHRDLGCRFNPVGLCIVPRTLFLRRLGGNVLPIAGWARGYAPVGFLARGNRSGHREVLSLRCSARLLCVSSGSARGRGVTYASHEKPENRFEAVHDALKRNDPLK
ncbi:lipopolysaccharide biosynthesis protein [Marinovum sp. B10]|uniref:lipopolysaccharide biosynthesis protein n=1 Tax=Marinovum sp. B10 TaxID=3449224 RepID=UPI003EDC5666